MHQRPVAESFFSTVKSDLADRFDSFGEAKMELFDDIEMFYNQQQAHSTSSPTMTCAGHTPSGRGSCARSWR